MTEIKITFPDSWELDIPNEYNINAADTMWHTTMSASITAYRYMLSIGVPHDVAVQVLPTILQESTDETK